VRARGFTLVEMLVSIAVITVLLGIAIPTMVGAMARARDVRCQANLKGLFPAFDLFRRDHRRALPYADINASFPRGWTQPWDQVAPYLDVPLPRVNAAERRVETWAPFVCPSDGRLAQEHGVSYWYGPWQMMGLIGQAEMTLLAEREPGRWPLLHDGDEFHRPRAGERGVNQLLIDATVRRAPASPTP
jgi:prepilin-type N-terminal cleavage/methylation domain-containing protein